MHDLNMPPAQPFAEMLSFDQYYELTKDEAWKVFNEFTDPLDWFNLEQDWRWPGFIETLGDPGLEDGLVHIGNSVAQHLESFKDLRWRGISHGVGNIDRGRPGIDRGLHHTTKEIVLGSAGILR